MLWPHLKIVLALAIPFSAVSYAHQLHVEADCQRIERTVQSSANVQWSLAHPREAFQRNRAEAQYLQLLVQDLNG
jgi:hypothetical protein